jgi:phosphatidylinositol alpha-1,6-mannosyltransferase
VSRLPPDDVVVYASTWSGAEGYDATQPFRVIRDRASVLLPTPPVAARLSRIVRAEGIESVWFGAAAPLGLLAPSLRRAGVRRLVATTHGHEVGWAMLPASRQLLRRIGARVDVVTYLGDYTRARLAGALGPKARLERLAPGVDTTAFRPDAAAGAEICRRLGLGERPVVVCVSRLVPRKGQDVLINALPLIREWVPDAALLLVGGGPSRDDLTRQAAAHGLSGDVVITGSVPWAELPAYYAAGDVFAMPCRTRWRGADVEGLGVVFLEAAACGLPVVAGRSGGAPDAVRQGSTGVVVDPMSVSDVAGAITPLLLDPGTAQTMGAAGRLWMEHEWRWDDSAARLTELLTP